MWHSAGQVKIMGVFKLPVGQVEFSGLFLTLVKDELPAVVFPNSK